MTFRLYCDKIAITVYCSIKCNYPINILKQRITNTTHLKHTCINFTLYIAILEVLNVRFPVGKHFTKTVGSIYLKLKMVFRFPSNSIINFANEFEGALAPLKNQVQSFLTIAENFHSSMKKFTSKTNFQYSSISYEELATYTWLPEIRFIHFDLSYSNSLIMTLSCIS